MNKKILIAITFLVLAALACQAGASANLPKTADPVATDTPLTGTLTSALPTDAGSCPIAQSVAPGSAFNRYTFVQGQNYDLNLSLEGASAGTEGNLLFVATQTFTVDFDGAAWLYAGQITASDCQYCEETAGDYVLTLADVPQLTGLIEVLTTPCTTGIGASPYKVHKLEIVSNQVPTPAFTATPIAATPIAALPAATSTTSGSPLCPGIYAQGDNQSFTVHPGDVYGFSWWFAGDSHEYVTLLTVSQDVNVSNFYGTVSCWPNMPSKHDTGVENLNHQAASLQSMMGHVLLSPSSAVTEIPMPQQ